LEKISANTHASNWFEIPATEMSRAKKFYPTILDIDLITPEMKGLQRSFFSFDPARQRGKVSGALVHHQDGNIKPGADGPVIYRNANPAIQPVADKIVAAAGKLILPKTLINEQVGYMAFFLDTEGNRMGLPAGK
jgi:uncharacterized protein